jgi:hypothetical protein
MQTAKPTDSFYLNVGMLHDYSYDKALVLQRARRGVKALGLEWGQLVSRNRRGHIADTRHIVSKYLRDHGFRYQEIAQALARANHTTSCYSVKRANELLEIDRNFRMDYKKFMNA